MSGRLKKWPFSITGRNSRNCVQLIDYQISDSTGKHFITKKITPNDVVLFKTNKSLHPTFDHYQIGLVKDTYEDFDKVSRKIDIKYFLSVEGNVREMSAKRMIREVIFAEDIHHAANFHPLCCRILEPNYFLLH